MPRFQLFGSFCAIGHDDPEDDVKQNDRESNRDEYGEYEQYADDRHVDFEIVGQS